MTRLRHSGHAEVVAASKFSVSAINPSASAASNSIAFPSSSMMVSSATRASYPALRAGSTVAAMRAVVAPGDGTLTVGDRPVPEPGPDTVRVRVHGAGINRADLMQRLGFYPAPPGVPAEITGLEFAGTVDACGTGVDGLAVGDTVF